MQITISPDGVIALPAELREQDALQPGETLEIQRLGRGAYFLRRKDQRPNDSERFRQGR